MTTQLLPIQIYRVIAHQAEEGGYWAEVLDLPGCVSQGETLEELQRNIREAIEAVLQREPVGGQIKLQFEPTFAPDKDVWMFVADTTSGTVTSRAKANKTWTAAL